MRIELSSNLTFFFKFIWIPMSCIAILVAGLIGFSAKNSTYGLIILAIMLPLILLVYLPFRRVRRISYDESLLYVKNLTKETTYDLSQVHAVNDGSLTSLDPSFEIVIQEPDGTLIKIDFLPSMIHVY